jgi:cell division septation protein DedD
MAEEARSAPREFQLETRHLALIIFVIAVLCISSFMLGRWVERQAARATPESLSRSDPAGPLKAEEVDKELTYFRTLDGDTPSPSVAPPPPEPKAAPPVRVESPSAATAAESAPDSPISPAPASKAAAAPAPPTSSQAAPKGGFLIQVLATKDRAAAAALHDRLASRGYPVSIAEGSAAGGEGMRKVRVGPFSSRAEAERVAKKLESQERVRTWIP